jgi:hypothetical protein
VSDRPKRAKGPNHFVGEWFGQRIFPEPQLGSLSLATLRQSTCPFLTAAKGETTECVKAKPSLGVCTITSKEGALYGRDGAIDWLVCPYRTLDHGLLEEVARRLFDIAGQSNVLILAAVTLDDEEIRASVRDALVAGQRVFVYFRNQLGGEISLSATARSPEFAFDITLVEIEPGEDHPAIGRYAIVEVQTMEFHGSYGAATTALRNALDLHGNDFGLQIATNPEWAGRGIQGPSIADTFKRTFYQMVFKFQLGLHDRCAGTVLALPTAVWNSWQRHLGAPTLVQDTTDPFLHTLPKPEGVSLTESITAWILVFDTDLEHGESPNPLKIEKVIKTDTPTLLHYAFDVAPEAALGGGATERVYSDICSRVLSWWPDLIRLTT